LHGWCVAFPLPLEAQPALLKIAAMADPSSTTPAFTASGPSGVSGASGTSTVATPAAGSHIDAATILVVEDKAALREHFAETLRDLGPHVTVETAVDGREALDRIEAGAAPDLVVSDIIMPRLDGEALLDALHRCGFPGAVIMLTALGHDDVVVRCLKRGACDYLVKPVSIDDLLVSAANALQHRPLVAEAPKVEYDPLGWFEVTGPTSESILFKYRKFLGLLERFRIPEPVASEVRLALDEFGRNAIEWGNRFDKGKKVVFGCRILPGKVMVYIEDEGVGFDPSKLPDPSADPIGHIERRQTEGKRLGGYGVHLIRNLMDKVIWNARGNRVVAIKYLR
jgi:CheY-like chemotaxis protein/anti-sigma regulatory factor (Ser/Thr protein kinase)